MPICLNNLLVSVVVPTHNRAGMIAEALESVFLQTYRPIELILVDDGSQDDTQSVFERWAKRLKNACEFSVFCIRQTNRGANAARNKGIVEAKGEFIAFLDSDDRWFPTKIEKQIAFFQKDPLIGDVYCGLYHSDLKTSERLEDAQNVFASGWLLRELLIRDITTPTSCHMVKKECFDQVGLFDENLPARQDWDMWIRIASKYKIGCVPEILVEQREHSGERVRSDPMNEIKAARQIYRKYTHLRDEYPFWVSLAARSAMYRRRGRVYYHRRLSIPKAFILQTAAILIWPFGFDSYAAFAGMLVPQAVKHKIHSHWNRVFGKTSLAIRSH